MDSLAGKLLIANANLFDPNFRRAIILVGHHDGDGAMGVVLNRALGVTVAEVVPALGSLVGDEAPVFVGGPVQPAAVVVVADFEDPSEAGVLAFDSVGFLPEETDEATIGRIRRARVFAGYAGWGEGQLESELEEESWVITSALAEDVFHPDPARLWDDVLRRLGHSYDLLRLMPVDPSMN